MNHTKPSHRILAVLLSVMLCVSMLPVTALAADADITPENDAIVIDTEETSPAAEEAPAEEAEEALAEEASEEEVLEEATELDPGVPETETLAEDGTAYSGTCGENLTWTLADGTLTISGTGAMENYTSGGRPWYEYRSEISTVVIEAGVTSIGDDSFNGCSALTSIGIPASVTSIGVRAFYGCSVLTSICIPEGVTSIGGGAFFGCEALASVRLPASLTQIKNASFYNCSALTSISIPTGVTSIGVWAFNRCSALTSISIPEGVTSIGEAAFEGCEVLSVVYYGGSEAQWNSISIGDSNNCLTTATIHYEADGPSGTCGENLTWTLVDGTLTISGTGAMSDYSATLSSVPWDSCRTEIQTVVLQPGVTSIGSYAFQSCVNLSSVSIPEGVTVIGRGSFRGCSSLTGVSIPGSVTNIYAAAFNSCGLTGIVIPEGVVSIGQNAFYFCSNLASVSLPTSVTSIISGAFGFCGSLREISVAAGNTRFSSENGVLFNKERTELLACPAGITGEYVIPAGVQTITANAFAGCLGLTAVTIPAGVASINGYAFYSCSGMTSITIPVSVTHIYDRAFDDCTSLSDVYYGGTETEWSNISINRGNDYLTGATLHCEKGGTCGEHLTWTIADGTLTISGTGAMDDYSPEDAAPWADYLAEISTIVIENGVTGIGAFAFNYCKSLASVSIADTVTVIGPCAFSCCDALASVTIPERMTSIGENAFYSCGSLTSIRIPAAVTDIGATVFWFCLALTEIDVSTENRNYCSVDGVLFTKDMTTLICCPGGKTGAYEIPAGVTSIEESAFRQCGSLTSISVPDSVTDIGEHAFYSCSGMTSINIPEGITSIADGTFGNCSTLTSINIPESVTSIGNSAFFYCSALTSVNIPKGVTSIGNNVFSYCKSLTSVNIPMGVTSIGYNVFCNCQSITSISIPVGVTRIGDDAFNYCQSLESISIPASVTRISGAAFYGCSALADVYYGGAETQWSGIRIDGDNDCLTKATIHYEAGFGSCGENLAWTLEDGTLTISGSGAMDNYTAGKAPWYEYRSKISTVVLESGVTGVGDYAFDGCSALTNVYYGGSEAQWNSISIGEENDYLTKASITFAIVAAVIGTVRYDTLSAATDAAQPGDTIILQADISDERFVVVRAGITLDLNGHSLTGATILYVTGSLVDSGSPKGGFSAEVYYLNHGEHTQFPVYNSATGTYSLYEMGFYSYDVSASTHYFGFDYSADVIAATDLMKTDAEQGRVVAKVSASWTEGSGATEKLLTKTFTYTSTAMAAYLKAPLNNAFSITIGGVSGITAQPVFVVLDANGSVMYTFAGPVWNIG